MIGRVTVHISVPDGEYSYEESITVKATANCVSNRLSGYSDRPDTYEDDYEDIEVYDENEIDDYVIENYGNVDYEWFIDEDSFEVE